MALTLVYIDGIHRLSTLAAAWYEWAISQGCPKGCVVEAYRTPEEQIAIFKARYTTTPIAHVTPVKWRGVKWYKRPGVSLAAVPGTSKHETGTALDLAEPAITWFHTNMLVHGWTDPVTSEDWHFEFHGTDLPPTPQRKEIRNMFTIRFADKGALYLWNSSTDVLTYITTPADLAELEAFYDRHEFASEAAFTAYRKKWAATMRVAGGSVAAVDSGAVATAVKDALAPAFAALPAAINTDASARLAK